MSLPIEYQILTAIDHTFRVPSTDADVNPSNSDCTPPSNLTLCPIADPSAWAIVEDYAAGIIDTLPEVEEKLTKYLRVKYRHKDWQEAYRAKDKAEDDASAAMAAIKTLSSKSIDATHPRLAALAISTPPADTSSTQANLAHTQRPPLHQLAMLETKLVEQVHELQKRKRVRGTPLMLEEMLNPIEEEVVDRTLDFPGGDDEIVEYVTREV